MVREAQPSGPYSLIGYSFGGLVAYEMAVALRGRRARRCPTSACSTSARRRRRSPGGRSPPAGGPPASGRVLTGQAVAAVGRRLPPRPSLDAAARPRRTPDAEFRFFLGLRGGVRRLPAGPVRRRRDLLPGRGLPTRPRPDAVRLAPAGPAHGRDRRPRPPRGHRRRADRHAQRAARDHAGRPRLGHARPDSRRQDGRRRTLRLARARRAAPSARSPAARRRAAGSAGRGRPAP